MWKYKTGELAQIGDNVLISKRWAKEHNVKQEAQVTDLSGLITVKLSDNQNCDFDMRSLTFVSRKKTLPHHILKAIRQYNDIDENDDSKDHLLNLNDLKTVLTQYLSWEGVHSYTEDLIKIFKHFS